MKKKNAAAVALGRMTSERKSAASRENGAKGGRPAGWTRTSTGDYIKGSWRVRGPLMGEDVFTLFRDGSRYTGTGLFEDAPSFTTRAQATQFVRSLEFIESIANPTKETK